MFRPCYQPRALCSRLTTLLALLSVGVLTVPLAVNGCGDGTGVGDTGSLRIDVNMTGQDRDPDGFTVSLDGGAVRAVQAAGTIEYSGVSVGEHTVALADVAGNCSVMGENPRVVSVATAAMTRTIFDVICTPTTGTLVVATLTTGLTADGDGYDVTLEGKGTQAVAPNGTTTFFFVAPGDYQVELSGVAGNCDVSSSNVQIVSISEGTTTEASFTIDCQLELSHDISFVSFRDGNYEIYVMRVGEPGPINLTNHPQDDGIPVWSPDGSKLAFLSDRGSYSDIYVMNADGTNPINVSNHPASDEEFVWSPSSDQLAFVTGRDTAPEIYVVNADGTGLTNLTNHPELDLEPAWSPDGARIAFASTRGGDYDIYVMNSDGTGVTNLTNHPAHDLLPVWSPDGTQIAFLSDRDSDIHILIMNADGTGVFAPTQRPWPHQDGVPAWSPDGEWIAFSTVRKAFPTNTEIYAARVDGSELVNLTNHPANDFAPSWSPDGTEIAFVRFHQEGEDVYIMNADGSDPKNLTNYPGLDFSPAWVPSK